MDHLIDDQLGGLLHLEGRYSPRDYLLDIATKSFCCDRSDGHSYCTTTTSSSSSSSKSKVESISATTTYDDHSISVSIEEGNENNTNTMDNVATKSSSGNKTLITKQKVVYWRSKICEWFYHVVDHFDLSRDLAFIALNYVDRYCAASEGATVIEVIRDKNHYKLLAMASLCLVIKLHGDLNDSIIPSGITVESWTIDMILQLGRDNYTPEQLKTMEIDVLQQLQWLLHPPAPQVFISCFLELSSGEEMIELQEMTSYIVELSIHDYYFVSFKPSVIAFASLCNATQMLLGPSSSSTMMTTMTMTNEHSSWLADLQQHLLKNYGYEETNKINDCRGRLMELYVNTGTKLDDFDFLDDEQHSVHRRESSPMSVIH